MENVIAMKVTLTKEQERQYLSLPFSVPPDIERVDVKYRYPGRNLTETEGVVTAHSRAVVDLALLSHTGELLGSSGSDRNHVWISALGSSAGFAVCEPEPGTWSILAGPYRIPEGGIDVEYEIMLTPKYRRLFKGDTHLHTTASDGASDVPGVVALACDIGLDYLFLTDHNNTAQNRQAGAYHALTVLPGTEWTHYKGHALFLGTEKPFSGSFAAASLDEARAFMQSAGEAGAFTALAHPFCQLVPWEWGFDVPYDGIEVWNGVMSERNERAVYFWHNLLCKGLRIPATGGSDYHRPGLLGSIAMPCLCVYAMSRSPRDILNAMRSGHSYISYLPDGPGVDIHGGGKAVLGESIPADYPLTFTFFGLTGGEEIKLITDAGTETIVCPADAERITLTREYRACKFVRAETYRSYAPGLPPMKSMLSNPVYLEVI